VGIKAGRGRDKGGWAGEARGEKGGVTKGVHDGRTQQRARTLIRGRNASAGRCWWLPPWASSTELAIVRGSRHGHVSKTWSATRSPSVAKADQGDTGRKGTQQDHTLRARVHDCVSCVGVSRRFACRFWACCTTLYPRPPPHSPKAPGWRPTQHQIRDDDVWPRRHGMHVCTGAPDWRRGRRKNQPCGVVASEARATATGAH